MITTLSPESTFDTVDPGVTYEWIQSLPPEQKDAALYRFCKMVEAHTTLVESFTLNQVIYRTISGGLFTESADSVAERARCDRKTILKGLSIAVEQNILEKNERPGMSTEYSFKPVEEWLSKSVVRKTDIRTRRVIELPTIQSTEPVEIHLPLPDGVVLKKDYLETDTEPACSVPVEDTPKYTPWKYVGQGIGRVYTPPELDAETGSKIESIHSATKEPRRIIIKRAVDLLHKQVSGIPNFIDDQLSPFLPPQIDALSLNVINAPTSNTVVSTAPTSVTKIFDTTVENEEIYINELDDVMTQIKLQLRIPIPIGMKDSIKRNWKGTTHFNNALAWCVDTADWLERENKLEIELLPEMLINAMKKDKKPLCAVPSPEKMENASAYAPKQPGIEPNEQQLQTLVEAKQKGLIRDLFDSAGDGIFKVIDKLGFAMPWYQWSGIQG